MTSGTVKAWFGRYGWIARSGEPDVYVPVYAVMRSGHGRLSAGQHVSFDIAPDRQGRPEAVNLKVD
jgi:cold shock CspA family protein